MTLTEFLLARYDEEERAAVQVIGGMRRAGKTEAHRQLREVLAHRSIVELHRNNDDGPTGSCSTCTDRDYLGLVDDEWPCDTLRALASVYSDHPDYRPEWRP